MKDRLFSISCETNFGKPKPNASGAMLGLWKFSHVGSGMKDSTTLQLLSETIKTISLNDVQKMSHTLQILNNNK